VPVVARGGRGTDLSGCDLPVYAGRGGGGEQLNPAYDRAAKPPKSIWRIPESRHVGGLDARRDEYERRVIGFVDQTLLGNATH
jgi:hypothetical protein